MKRLILILAVTGWVSVSLAVSLAEKILLIDGDRSILVDTDAGTAKRLEVDKVIRVGDTPDDPGDPDPPADKFGLAEFCRAGAKSLDADNREAVGMIYQLLADRIKAGEVKNPQAAATAAKTAVDLFLRGDDRTEWAPFRTSLKEKLDTLAKEGKIKTVADVGQAYSEIAAGLRTEEAAISPELLALILKIIEIVLQLIGG